MVELRSIIIMVLCCISPAGSKIVIFVACVFFFFRNIQDFAKCPLFLGIRAREFSQNFTRQSAFYLLVFYGFFFARANTKNRGQ